MKLGRLKRAVWGELNNSEIKQFGLLALSLMFTVGPYWMLRGIREALFIDLVGVRWQPWGKIAAFLFIIPLVLLYSKLIDYIKKDKLFYVVYPVYICSFLLIAFFIAHPHHATIHLSWVPGQLLGWISYMIIESFGALAPALFWSFVVSHTDTMSAKRGYGMIISITQIGTISGTLFVSRFSETLGLPIMIALATCGIAVVPFLIRSFICEKKRDASQALTPPQLKSKTGFFAGLKLLLQEKYLLGIFVVTTAYEVVGTMLEFQMNILGHHAYPTKELFASFYARYGFFTNGVTFLFAMFGTSLFLRRFGLRVCLLLFPVATGMVMIGVRFFPILPVFVVSMIILKCLSYALNNPSKEILYIPTTKDMKFKAKSWIDVFGIRSIKASGSGINALFRTLAPAAAMVYTTPIVLVLVTLWIIVARRVSVKNHELVKEGKVIGAGKAFEGAKPFIAKTSLKGAEEQLR